MAKLFGHSRAHILFVEADGVRLLSWENAKLSLIARYRTIDPDFAAFKAFLLSEKKPLQSRTPFVIIADVIEEDFRIENLAHVTGSDREALFNRKLNTAFRTTPYRIARVVGREREGRKDDRVLFTALTRAESIDPWIGRILEQQIPIQTLTSAAYMMELFAQSLKIKSVDHLLLVNQEGSGLRQTYLQKGRVIFSRLTLRTLNTSGTFEEILTEQCDQTRKYLERIKQLPYDVVLNVHVFRPEQETEMRERELDLLRFHYTPVNELISSAQIDLGGEAPGALVYTLVEALAHKGVRNVYAQVQTRRYFFIGKVIRALHSFSAIVLVGAVAVSTPAVLDVTINWDRESSLAARTQPLLQEYEVLRERFPETPIPSNKMELVVETYLDIANQIFEPHDTLAKVGLALADSPNLKLTNLEWTLVEVPPEPGSEVVESGLVETEAQLFQKAIVAGRSEVVTTLEGRVEAAQSHREARALVLQFADFLERQDGITFTPIEMPMDAGPDSVVATTLDGAIVRAGFGLELRQQAAQELPEVTP